MMKKKIRLEFSFGASHGINLFGPYSLSVTRVAHTAMILSFFQIDQMAINDSPFIEKSAQS
jgi:hypothetical protein